MSNLLRRVSHHDIKKDKTLVRSKTYGSDLTKLEKRLPVSILYFSYVVKLKFYNSYINLTFHIHLSLLFFVAITTNNALLI